MFNYFACRKLAEEELKQKYQKAILEQNKQKNKGTFSFHGRNLINSLSGLEFRDQLAQNYKRRVVGFIKDVSYNYYNFHHFIQQIESDEPTKVCD